MILAASLIVLALSSIIACLGLAALIRANETATCAKAEAGYWQQRCRLGNPNNPRSITEAPAFDRITAVIAHNEAKQADWDDVEGWDA